MQIRSILLSFFLGLCLLSSHAQEVKRQPFRFLEPSEEYNKARGWTVTGVIVGSYAVTFAGLNSAWYANYPRGKFHTFNDIKEWEQMDKTGHFLAPYFAGRMTYDLYKWAGMSDKRALWGGLSGFMFLTGIEIMDGFSEKWGFSVSDMGFNAAGAGLFYAQHFLWGEQRILLKMSSHRPDYSHLPEEAQIRAGELMGTTFGEQLVKDYNGFTLWVSGNIHSFLKNPRPNFPKWLNVSVGYGAEGLLGGFENKWCDDPNMSPEDCPEDQLTDYTHVRRVRQFYLSIDVDLQRIETKSRILKFLFGVFNIVKIPAPTLEINSEGKVKFHPIYF